jgi:general secretion pathway protein C
LLEQRGARVLVAVLLVALAVDGALILTRALSQHALPPPASHGAGQAPISAPVNPTVELAGIVNAHLFGVAGVQAGGNAPQTTIPLILAGVIAEKDPAKGQAIIGDTASAGKLYAVGAMIPGGARLHAVYGDHVLIERGGRLETLPLPRNPMKGGALTSAPSPGPAQNRVQDNSTLLAGLVRVQPVFNQGKLGGYRIFPGGTRGTSAFTQLGLRAGDLIVAINGSALDDAARAMEVLQTLSSSASATITVSRNGASQEVNLNLANLNTETEAPAADNSATATAPGPAQMRGRGGFPGGAAPPAPSTASPAPGEPSAPATTPAPAPSPAEGASAAN